MVAQKHSPLEVKIATTAEEREAIFHFRYQVYVKEMKQQQDRADHRRQWLRDSTDEGAILFYIADGREVIATLRRNLADSRSRWPAEWTAAFALDRFASFGPTALSVSSRFMIAHHWRQSTLAGRLVVAAYQHAREVGARFDFTLSRLHVVDLDEHVGFRRYTDNYYDESYGGLLVPMVCVMEDAAYLRAVGSPFARAARHFTDDSTPGDWFCRQFAQPNLLPARLGSPEQRWSNLTRTLGGPPEQTVRLLHGASAPEAKLLLKHAILHPVRAGEVILQPGTHIGALFVVISGAVELSFPDGRPSQMVRSGECFGAEGLLENSLSEAKIVAQSDAQLLVLPETAISLAIEGNQAMRRVLSNLAQDRQRPALHPVPAAARSGQNSTAA